MSDGGGGVAADELCTTSALLFSSTKGYTSMNTNIACERGGRGEEKID